MSFGGREDPAGGGMREVHPPMRSTGVEPGDESAHLAQVYSNPNLEHLSITENRLYGRVYHE